MLALKEYWDKGLDFNQYSTLIEQLFEKGLHTGLEQKADYLEYTRLNLSRNRRVLKTTVIPEELKQLLKQISNQYWLVITEGWCGDSAQQLAVLVKIAEASENRIHLKMLLRDENPELMDAFLSHGNRSIPKLIAFNETNELLFTWGPRSNEVTALFADWKAEKDVAYAKEKLHSWYPTNKGAAVISDIFNCLSSTKKH